MRYLPAGLIALAIVLAPLVWNLSGHLLLDNGPVGLGSSAIDSGARIELEDLRQEVEFLKDRVKSLEDQVSELRSRPTGSSSGEGGQIGGPNGIIDAYAETVLIGDRRQMNKGLNIANPKFLESFLGRPRADINDTCQPMTNPALKDKLKLQSVGPIQVRMLQPAIDSLTRVFEKVFTTDPDLYARINTAGSLCVRRIRGTQNSLSTHSFGLSVDLNIDGQLDTLGDGKTQLGLTILADFFLEEGWIWGAGFTREDSMHFEVSRDLLERWRSEGLI